jgi:diaminopimelate decarboxylase
MNLSWKKLRHLTDTYGDYFYILDLEQFNRNYQNFLAAFQSIYPNSQIAYSYKTNYTPRLCQLTEQMHGYAEVVSGMEYDLALKIGVAPERIIFNGPYKQAHDIERALLNHSIVNIDSTYEVKHICALSSQFPQQTIQVGIRCNFIIGTESPSLKIREAER